MLFHTNICLYFTDRVLSPVVDSLVPMRAETQQNVARITLKTFCEAWLEHIRGRRIKFRYTPKTRFSEHDCHTPFVH